MGQDHSSGKRGQEAEAYGNVFVKLDQDTYLSDDTVTGTLYVQLRRPYPGDKICLKVKGKEFAKWVDKEHKQRQREDGTIEHYTVDVPREAEFLNVKHIVDIYDWRNGSVIPPGQFSFPISFKIPPGLPSTFFLRSGAAVAEISYYVEAYLKPEKELYPKIKHKRPITIRQALRSDITTKEVSINQEVSTCCCLSKGSVAMWTAFEKNAYAPGEEARIVTEVDNSKCELPITNVRFELVQYIKLTAQNNSKALHFGIVGENLGRVEPGQSFLKEQRKEASIHLPPGIEGSSKAYKGDNQVQEYNLSPQQAISPSTNGNLVKSNFGLRVACGMDGCVCDTMPTTELPITIYSIIQRKVPDPMPPAGWNPTPMPASNISIIISINGVAPGTTTSGPAQPQGNALMSNNQMPTQPALQQDNYQQQAQYQQQSQYTQQSQQPLSNRQQESQYQQEQRPQYQQQLPQSYSQAQSLQSIQSKPQFQQEAQYQQQQSPLRQSQQYKQEAQYQQPLSNRQSEAQYRPQEYHQQQSPQRSTQPQSQSQIQIQPKQQYQQEPQYQQQQSPQRQQESSLRKSQEAQYQQQQSQYPQQQSQYPQQQSPQRQQESSLRKSQEAQYPQQQSNRLQESQYAQQQSPQRQQYQQESHQKPQYQQQQSPLKQPQSQSQFQESQYRQQEQAQYQSNRIQESPQRQQYQQQESQIRQQQSPLRQSQSNYQLQESQSRHQEQSPPRQQYQQEQSQYQSNRQSESQYQQQQSPQRQQYQQESQIRQPQYQQHQQQGYSQQNYNGQQGGYSNSQYGRGGERY